MTTKEKAIEMINEGLKKCKICDTIKPKSDFYKEKKASDGYKSQCKDCYNTRKEKRNVARLKAEKAMSLVDKLGKHGYVEGDLTLHNYKEPLTPIHDGFGFLGTLSSTKDGKFVQCHICGHLYDNLCGHIYGTHKMKVRGYKKKFGLSYGTALVSERYRLHMKQKTLDRFKTMTDEEKAEMQRQAKAAYRDRVASRGKRPQPLESLEEKNKKGTCPDQILAKIAECSEALGKTPSKRDFIDYCKTQRYVHLIYKVFGSWSNALDLVGLEPVKQEQRGGMRGYTDEELLDYLRDYTVNNNKLPAYSDFKRGFLPSHAVYVKRWGSIVAARAEAGLEELLEIEA